MQVKGRSTPVYIYTILIQKHRLRRFNNVRTANIRRLGHHLSGEGFPSQSRRASLSLAAAAAASPTALSPLMRRANERLTSLESAAKVVNTTAIHQLQQFQQNILRRESTVVPSSAPPTGQNTGFAFDAPASPASPALTAPTADLETPALEDGAAIAIAVIAEPEPEPIGAVESPSPGGAPPKREEGPGVDPYARGVSSSLSDGDVLRAQRAQVYDSSEGVQSATATPPRRLPPLYEDTDITLFEQGRDLYLRGKFAAAQEIFRFAGGNLGNYFVERCHECLQQRHDWPGYYTWDVK